MGAPNSTFFTSLSPPLASFFFSPSASTAGLPSHSFWVWVGMALSVPSFTQIPRIDWIFWSPDVEKFSSVFVENRSCLRLSTWLRGLAPCQGLTDCKATLFQGGLLEYLVIWLLEYLVTWVPGYLNTWLRYLAPCLDWGLAGLHSSKVGYLKEGRNLNLFLCISKHIGGSRTQEMSDELSIYLDMTEVGCIYQGERRRGLHTEAPCWRWGNSYQGGDCHLLIHTLTNSYKDHKVNVSYNVRLSKLQCKTLWVTM